LESYIVRIYRRDGNDPEGIVGMVSGAEDEGGKAFRNAGELAGILAGLPGERAEERRGTGRLKLRLPVTIRGTGEGGESFTEDAFLEDFSSGGAYMLCKHPVSPDARLSLSIDPGRSDVEMQARVVRVHGQGGRAGVGVCFEC